MDGEFVEFIKSVLETTGLFGLCAILIYLLHKTLPKFEKSLNDKGAKNAASITKAIVDASDKQTGAIEKQTDSTRQAYSELKDALRENTNAVNSLREHRRDDVQRIEEILDHVKGTYRMMQQNFQAPEKQRAANDGS